MRPHPKFGSNAKTDNATDTYQKGMRRFITYIIEVSEESRANSEQEKNGKRPSLSLFLSWDANCTYVRVFDLSHSSRMLFSVGFPPNIFSFVFQFIKCLLNYLQAHWFFPPLSQNYWWARQKKSLAVLPCFLFLEFPFDYLSFHICWNYPSDHEGYPPFLILGWPKSPYGFFHKIKNIFFSFSPKTLFGYFEYVGYLPLLAASG